MLPGYEPVKAGMLRGAAGCRWFVILVQMNRRNKIVRQILFWMVLLGLWSLMALMMNNSILCPAPWDVVRQMMVQLTRPDFFSIVGITTLRALSGLLISFAAGILSACEAHFLPVLKDMMNNLVSLMQAIPNVCYIILLLFWTGRNNVILIVIFCLLFPVAYRNFLETLDQIQNRWKDVFAVYPQPWWIVLTRACFPAMEPVFASTLISGSSMAFKAAVMAEVLASANIGIGRSMQAARVNVEVAQVMAWMVWLLILVFLFEKIWRKLIEKLFGKADDYEANR